MTKTLQFLILFAFVGMGSPLLMAQDETFTAGTDDLWTNLANWSNNTIATGRATITTDVDLEAVARTIKDIRFTTSSTKTVSNGTLIVGDVGATNTINNATSGSVVNFDCNFTVNVDAKRFRNNGLLVFTSGSTLTLGTNLLTITNINNTTSEFNGIVTGSSEIELTQGLLELGSTSDLTGFTGNFTINGTSQLISNTNNVFISSTSSINFNGANGSVIVNGTNSIEGSINRSNISSGTSEVVFNANQANMTDLIVDTQTLELDFDPSVTLVHFSGSTISNGGIVNLKNLKNGTLKIGNSATDVPQAILDTWLLDGVEPVDGTLSQDASGYINKVTYTSTTGQNINWEDGSSWVGGTVPGPTDNVLILGSLIINSDVVVNNFTNRNDPGILERVTVNPGYSLTINGDAITRHNLWANSNSTSFASLIFNGSVTDQISYFRYVNSVANGNDLIASPVSLDFDTFATDPFNGDLFENPTNTSEKLFGPFNNTTGQYETMDTVIDATELITPGIGYRAGTTSGSTIYFKGYILNSPVQNILVNITDETTTPGATGNYKTWNLIGNPFPSYIDFGAFFTENASAFDSGAYQAIYGYDADDSDGSNFTIWNAFNASDKITPGQSFFVRAKSGGGTVTFTPAMRTIGASDDFIANRSETPNFVLSEIFLSNQSSNYSTKIYFANNQTRGLDPGYDAGAYAGSADGIFTHLVENNANVEFAIQALPYNDFNDVVVPLGIKSEANTQLTIGLNTETTSIPSTVNVYLEDNVTNTWTLLNNSDYVFTPSENLNGTGRFYIHYSSTALSIKDDVLNGLSIYSDLATNTVIVKGQLQTKTSAFVYDIQGRLVLQDELDTFNTTNTINVNALKTGIYIVELTNGTQNRSQKIMIN
ncbi:T9SS type A sorting domain-containing protein [Winogradskyella eckloniae]|uniref:T9SS type A sorting domain-containing protein n=1 Tax=Winogradskyella eckloniae TaxID=1089306 RepID=UPI0015668E3D|nr:T9SS type A sorting domain-containing protein [Winogradskyella eckloniae]NRD20718.1 T9SS type A sorting domain-containing protein [Winogradskyella eckloniae]